MSPEKRYFSPPDLADRVADEQVSQMGLQIDPTLNKKLDFDYKSAPNGLPPISQEANWWSNDADAGIAVPLETEQKSSLAYKAGKFLGSTVAKKLVVTLDTPLPEGTVNSLYDQALDDMYVSNNKLDHKVDYDSKAEIQIKLTENEEYWLDAHGYDNQNAAAIEMIQQMRNQASQPKIVVEIQKEAEKHVVDESQVASASEELSTSAVVEALEKNRVVKVAPKFRDMLMELDRDNMIRHYIGNGGSGGAEAPSPALESIDTEHNSMVHFGHFLQDVINLEAGDELDQHDRNLVEIAKDMQENLTFIGEKERTEAARAIAEHWKEYLRSNPEAQICVLTEISSSEEIKSDKFLFDGVLQNFSDEELEQLSGRLVTSLSDLHTEPENARIVLLDDWVISGTQMKKQFRELRGNPNFSKFLPSMEIQVVTSTKDRIENGLMVPGDYGYEDFAIPIRSYFMSHESEQITSYTSHGHRAYESGAHSSVDYDFETSYISRMQDLLNSFVPIRDQRPMPGITRIIREYRKSTLPNIARLHNARKVGV